MTSPVLEQWLARENELRTQHAKGPGPGVATLDEVRGKTGLELMQAVLHGTGHTPTIGQTLDFLLVDVSPGHAVFQGAPGQGHLNPMGTVHGGWFATLLDSALGCAVHSLMPAGRAYTTAELSVNIVKALSPKVQRVRTEGRVLHCGRQLATAEVRLVGTDGTLYAHGTCTCLVFDLPPQSKP